MGCSPDKPQGKGFQLVMIQSQWPGVLAVGPAPAINYSLPTNKEGLTRIIQKLKNVYKIDFLICLLEGKQMRQMGIQDQFTVCQQVGLRGQVYPIVDRNVPYNLPEFKDLIIKVVEEYLNKGKRVLVHCKNGKGRSGLFVASCLVYKGYNRNDAIKLTRKWVSSGMPHEIQQQFINNTLKFS